MKALSLRQPWAWMVVHGGKDIENRKWRTHFRGAFLIHAAIGMTPHEYEAAVAFARAADPQLVVPPAQDLLRGGIIGRATIVDVIPPCGDAISCFHRWHIPSQYGFKLADVEASPFDKVRGALMFFDPEKMREPAQQAGEAPRNGGADV